jgi:hypothetical protein
MIHFVTLPLLALLAGAEEGSWRKVSQADGIAVLSRQQPGSPVAEMKALGEIDAPPHEVYRVLRDYPNYNKTMPHTEESRVLATSEEGRVVDFYSVVAAPVVDKRDYVIRTRDESDWREGQGYLKVTWKELEEGAPPVKPGVVRVKRNEGYWVLEPREGGKKTFATYYLYTDPGGALPSWVVNMANRNTVPEVFKTLRRHAVKK